MVLNKSSSHSNKIFFSRSYNIDDRMTYKNNKAQLFVAGPCYIYGLVSIGKKIPYTIIKIIFSNIKDFTHYFINILFLAVDKENLIFGSSPS